MGTSISKSGENNHNDTKESTGFYQLSQPLQSQSQQQQENNDKEPPRSLGKNSKEIKRQYHDKFIKDAKEVRYFSAFFLIDNLVFCASLFSSRSFSTSLSLFCFSFILSFFFSFFLFHSRIFIKEIRCFVKQNLKMRNNIIIIL
jgi:hypothetical protein